MSEPDLQLDPDAMETAIEEETLPQATGTFENVELPADMADDPIEQPHEHSPSEEVVEVEGGDNDKQPDEQEPEPQQQPQIYSTRGRTIDHNSASIDPLERLARQALGELPLHRERAVLQNSFLSDSITEEERRTRTRYVPAVEGMQALKKQQVKADLALMSATAGASSSRKNVSDGAAAAAAADGKDDDASSLKYEHDALTTDAGADGSLSKKTAGTVQIDIRGTGVQLNVPNSAFAPPPPDASSSSVNTTTGSTTTPAPPNMIDSITAFDPPRPPESVGSKKKHRMVRWERRPADIDTDLRNYRRTVHKTREELARAQTELVRVKAVESLVRRNYLLHLQAQKQEWDSLSNELDGVQRACLDLAGLSTATRTRNKAGFSKNNAFSMMREVLALMRSKGLEMEAKGISPSSMMEIDDDECAGSHGVGGVGAVNFIDWERSTEVKPTKLASAWIVPGDHVETPYGQGNVLAVLGIEKVDPEAAVPSALLGKAATKDADAMQVDETTEETASADKNPSAKLNVSVGYLVPRIAVRLPFGVGYFPVGAVVSKEKSILSYSEERLAQRWKGLAETGVAMGTIVDCAAMSAFNSVRLAGVGVSEGAEAVDTEHGLPTGSSMIPFGAGMFPTAAGRGALLAHMTIDELDKEFDSVLYQGAGILGEKDNEGVTKEVREREDVYEDNLRLEATVLQLKNQLYRQRRLRLMNERTYVSTQERAARVEALVSEMRTDLKTLKRRLDEDVLDLGIDEQQSEQILKAYYDSLDYRHAGEASPPKRAKREFDLEHGLTDEDEDDLPSEITGTIAMEGVTAA